MKLESLILKEETISSMIHFIRGERVMLDSVLAQIYGVSTTRLNEQVKRNIHRFPTDFIFEITKEEFDNLISQNATSSWGGRRKLPRVFTEHGAIMLASVLNSEVAVNASIPVVRAFIKLREFMMMSRELTKKLEEFEQKTNQKLSEHDKMIKLAFDTLKKVLIQDEQPRKKIGFLNE